MTANGKFGLPPYGDDSPSRINDISVFLYSYTTGRNFTLAHPDEDEDDDSGAIGDMMAQEDGSTVKHLNWVWPDCLVGDGEPSDSDSDRGIYNVRLAPSSAATVGGRRLEGTYTLIRTLRSPSAKTSASTATTTTPSSISPSP